jgi:hypothetical protein
MPVTPQIVVVAINAADDDYVMVYGPFDNLDSADVWMEGRIDHARFSYSARTVRTPE